MPSTSKKQHNFMAAVANNPKFAKKAGVPSSVGKEFLTADKGKTFKQGGMMKKKMRKFDSGGMAYLKSMTGEADPNDSKEYMNSNPLEKAKRLGLKPGSKDFRMVMNQMGGGSKKDLASLKSDLQYSARNLGEAAGMTPVGMGLRSIKKAKDMMPKSYDEEMGMKKGGKVHSDIAKDRPMMKKVAAKAVKGHEKRMHGMAKGGKVGQLSKADGCATKGKSKGTMVKMKYGGAC
jgi:hypothetical protein